MRAVLLIGLLVGVLTWHSAPAIAAAPLSLTLVNEPAHVETVLGDRFMITTEITNTGRAPSGEILAHLNVASIEGSVYVDPEDWSQDRSQQLSLKPGESRSSPGRYRPSMLANLPRTSPSCRLAARWLVRRTW